MYNGSTIKYSVSFRTVAVDGVVSFFFFWIHENNSVDRELLEQRKKKFHVMSKSTGELTTFRTVLLAKPSTELMLYIKEYGRVLSDPFLLRSSQMSLLYSDGSMWREYMLYFFPLPFPHSLSLSLPVPKMSLLGILSPGFLLKQWPLFASIIL